MNTDHMNPVGYAKQLAAYITDPSTIRVRTLETFGRAPSVEKCRELIVSSKPRPRQRCNERYRSTAPCGHDGEFELDINGVDRCVTCQDEKRAEKAKRAADKQARIDALAEQQRRDEAARMERNPHKRGHITRQINQDAAR